jgi:hypothetical protein
MWDRRAVHKLEDCEGRFLLRFFLGASLISLSGNLLGVYRAN